jgi:malonyl-CoA/methylmalonyl-CoA synthetase
MTNLYSTFEQHFPADLDRTFLTDQQGVTQSYRYLVEQSARLANYFQSMGLQPGDRIAVQVHKSPMVMPLYLAALRAGLIYLPLNTGYTASELAYLLGDAEPALMVVDPGLQAGAEQAAGELPFAMPLLALASDGSGTWLAEVAKQPDAFNTVLRQSDDVAAILYTSGTTGLPKGAMLTHANLASNARVLDVMWGFSSDDVLLHALPIFHVHGLFVACHAVLMAGASMRYLPSFNEAQVIAALPDCTVMMGVPTHYTRLLASEDFNADVCRTMRLFISGSAPMLETTHQQFHQRTGQYILERYGMSETIMLVSNPLAGERRPGTVGYPLPGVVLRIVDDANQPVAIGDVGNIQVKGPNVFAGYWRKPEKTAEEFTADGFFNTGDQGCLSDDGYIAIVGRAKDMVISGGLNVYPKEVESVLDRLPGVLESAVFGVSDDDLGERVVAAMVSQPGQTLSAELLKQAAREKLSGYKVPKDFYFIDALPRNTMGKVQKNVLRQRFAAAH